MKLFTLIALFLYFCSAQATTWTPLDSEDSAKTIEGVAYALKSHRNYVGRCKLAFSGVENRDLDISNEANSGSARLTIHNISISEEQPALRFLEMAKTYRRINNVLTEVLIWTSHDGKKILGLQVNELNINKVNKGRIIDSRNSENWELQEDRLELIKCGEIKELN